MAGYSVVSGYSDVYFPQIYRQIGVSSDFMAVLWNKAVTVVMAVTKEA